MQPTDPLDSLLERWRTATPVRHESVSSDVWRRIAASQQTVVEPNFWERLEAAIARPSFAVAYVAACVLLGLFIAEMRLSRLQEERTVRLEQNYLRLVDPLLKYAMQGDNPATVQPTRQ